MSSYLLALPEIFLAVAGMAALVAGVFRGGNPTRMISWLSVLILAVTLVLVMATQPAAPTPGFGGLFLVDRFAIFLKVLVLFGSALAIMMSFGYIEREGMARFELPVLLLFSALGMLMILSANDLIALYLGIELMSLALYVVAAFRRDTVRSTEAGLKYFVLGALSSGMLLYGASLIYGFAGTTTFAGLATAFGGGGTPAVGLIIGIVFLVAGMAFKVSAVPFHMWTPDVYEGAPTPITAFFAVAPKIAALGLFTRVMISPLGALLAQWQQIIVFIAIASMALGAFAAINQSNIKRLMAYSSIGNIGYALVGLAAGTKAGVVGVLVYMTIYLFMTIGTFACILCMRQKGRMVEQISDLAGLSRTQPLLAAVFAVFMFSMAGIPPLAGFFGKLYVFVAAIEGHLYGLAIIGVVTSVVGAFYYLRIVKVMYFDEPSEAFDRPFGWELSAILAVTGLFILLFFVFPGPIVDSAGAAAASLFPGMIGAVAPLDPFYRLAVLDEIDSTNAEAQRRAAAGAPAGTLIQALRQTAGRGRRGRAWQSPPGNLAFSLLLRPAMNAATAATLGFVAGLALAEAIDGLLPAGRSSRLKWPNDLLVDGRKLAGILLEAAAGGGGAIDHLVIGVGVNIVAHPDALPYPATDLLACGGTADATTVLSGFAGRFLPLCRRWEGEGFAAIRAAWLDRAEGYGGPVTVRLDRATLEGRFAALDGQGALLLETSDGSRRSITAGDLFFAAHG